MSELVEHISGQAGALSRLEDLPGLLARAEALVQGGAQRLQLGFDEQGRELFALGAGEGPRRLLLVGGPTGEGLLAATVALRLAETLRRPGWQSWVVAALRPEGLQDNQAALDPGQGLAEQAAARRGALEAGADPLLGLPVDHELLWQPDVLPDGAPDEALACTPGALALARAVRRLQPDLVVVLDDELAGPVELGLSEALDETALAALTGALREPLAVMAGRAPLRRWAGSAQALESVSLLQPLQDLQRPQVHSSQAVREVLASGQGRLMGGVTLWQFAAWQQAGLCVLASLPRFCSPQLADIRHAGQQRQVQVELLAGQPGTTLWRLADGTEVLRRPTRPEEDRPGPRQVPLSQGLLAIESAGERLALLGEAAEQVAHLAGSVREGELARALSLLRYHQQSLEGRMMAWRTAGRYQQPARRADMAFWQGVFPAQSAQLLGGVRHELQHLDRRDPDIDACLAWLEQQITSLGERADAHLQAVSAAEWAASAAGLVEQALALVDGGPLQAARQERQAEQLTRELKAARKRARDLKNLRVPARERREQQELVRQLEEQYEQLPEALKAASKATKPAPERTQEPAAIQQTPTFEPSPESPPATEPAEEPTPAPPTNDTPTGQPPESADDRPAEAPVEARPAVLPPEPEWAWVLRPRGVDRQPLVLLVSLEQPQPSGARYRLRARGC